ncbi:unnamed protein product [Urochloa humidicola]
MFFRSPAAGDAVNVMSSNSSSGSRVSSSSSLSGMSSNGGGACDQQSAGDGSNEVGVAVGKEVECKANLMWVLSNLDAVMVTGDKRKATVVLLHVHRPAKTIPFMGAKFPAEQLHESEVTAFRQAETQAMNRAMAKYRATCAKVKVQAVCKVVEDGDIAQGILRLVAQHGIRRLVVGAAADKRYSSKMRAPSSRTAATVQQQAHPLCAIWFLCKGNLVCTRFPAAAREPEEPPCPPPSLPHRSLHEQQEEDIQSIFAEAEVLRREREISSSSSEQQQEVAALEAEVVSYKHVIQDLQEKLSEAHCLLFSMEREQEDLRAALAQARRQRDAALRSHYQTTQVLMELSYEEVLEATQNLDDSLRLGHHPAAAGGGSGYGAVYRAILRRGDEVAVKVLNNYQQQAEGMQQFQQQVEELSKLRHPNLVPLLGFCSSPQAIVVYEYLPGGSLQDHLAGMLWPERTRIAAEVRSALAFLHRNNTVHGHLNPANVLLLDLTATKMSCSKVSDSGLCRLLVDQPGAVLRCTLSASTAPYLDPEFLTSGDLRPASDAYAFGILLLRLLTGRPPMGLARHVQAALEGGTVATDILDPAAGEWPYAPEQAQQLARLAVSCCDMASHNRPDLTANTVANTLECFL